MAKKRLEKKLRLFDVFAISTGAMFSSGFFLLPGIAAAQTGPSVYLAYLASGLLIVPAMLSVAELSTAMPRAGGMYYFLDRSLGPMIGTIGGLGSWIGLMFKSSFALLGMGAYLAIYIDVNFLVLALVLTVVFGILNIFGAKETTFLQRILVGTLVGILAVFIIQGIASVPNFDLTLTDRGYESFFTDEWHGFIATIGLVFVSYMGLTKVTSVAEEIQNPDRNIPLGMFLSLITAVVIYVIGVYIMTQFLNPDEFYSSLTPVADAGTRFLSWLPGQWGVVAMVVAAVAAFASTGNAGIMSASRYPFAMSRDKLVSPAFSKIGRSGTPVISIIITVVAMIAILLLFDVEAVAKLASAFQLLLFAILSFSVIVMRESQITGYKPGFKSPFYPWMQIAGMLISVWLIAEMGILAVGFTGILVVFCVAWYFYYAGKEVKRQGAIFHLHERLGRLRYEGLEHELISILNEKHDGKEMAYEEVIARSIVVDKKSKVLTIRELMKLGAETLSQRLDVDETRVHQDLEKRFTERLTYLGSGVSVAFLNYDDVDTAEMVVFRTAPFELYPSSGKGETVAVIFLIVPDSQPGLDMRLVGHLAEIVQPGNFKKRWMAAVDEKQLRKILITDEHFLHVKIGPESDLKSVAGRHIRDLSLPGESLIAFIYRSGEIVIPHGQTEIQLGDELSIIGRPEDIRNLDSDTKQLLN